MARPTSTWTVLGCSVCLAAVLGAFAGIREWQSAACTGIALFGSLALLGRIL